MAPVHVGMDVLVVTNSGIMGISSCGASIDPSIHLILVAGAALQGVEEEEEGIMLRKVVVVPDAGDAADGAGKPRSAAAFFKVPRLLVGLAAASRFYGDVKSGPEVTVSGGAQLGVNAGRAADLGKFPATGSLPASIGCPPRYIGSVSATEVEQSEDYTRIIARGPNPKTTHIFGDCILEPCTESYWLVKLSGSGEELRRVCSYCKKKLDGNDLCFYRGEKSFCSGDCRDQEILIEDEEESNTAISSPISIGSASSFHDDLFMAGMAVLDMSTSSPHA
uniref:FLZ-type domain-containing protein n=1 Tax=Oryza brachyantha TaxID=4533 RepID=J3M4H9_ORYBR